MNCPKCGTNVDYFIDGVCPNCFNLSTPYAPAFNLTFNYECPDCKGRFNAPSYGSGLTNCVAPKCPFCGRTMIGLQ